MASTLLLLLKGPMQSWGDSSRYKQRTTEQIPTKSGVLGLLAAAEGRRRTDPIENLAELTFAVRVDQPGTLLRDFQTAEGWQTGTGNNLVSRYYLSDAAFVAAVESENDAMIDALANAVRGPRFPLYLGRRSCPAPPQLMLGVQRADAVSALRQHEQWHAHRTHRVSRPTTVELPIFRDARPGERGVAQQDVPISFAQEHRRYGWREVIREPDGVRMNNPDGGSADPFFEAVVTA